MASIVAALFIAGGKSVNRAELDQICDLLNIKDSVKKDLPVGPACTYYLYLSSNAQLPKECADPAEPIMQLLHKAL